MTKELDPTRLKQIRESHGISQQRLAVKAGLNKQTVYRLERGGRPTRPGTLARLSKALHVETDVLTGEKPIPEIAGRAGKTTDNEEGQLKIRLDGATRNAFTLAKLRYDVSLSRIFELAPFLFVIAAENSLQRRRAKLEELENALSSVGKRVSNIEHWWLTAEPGTPISPGHDILYEAIEEERNSIERRDIFAEKLPGKITPDWEPNPFFNLLKELASSCEQVAKIDAASSDFFDYQICPDEALTLSGGDKKIAGALLSGLVPIREIPPDLLAEERTAERMDWLRTQVEAIEAKKRNLSSEGYIDQLLPETNQDEDAL